MNDIPRARVVDERDTKWESDVVPARVFVYRPYGEHEVYDIDDETFDTVLGWARKLALKDPFGIALRTPDVKHGPGLVWLVRPVTDPDEQARVNLNTVR